MLILTSVKGLFETVLVILAIAFFAFLFLRMEIRKAVRWFKRTFF